MNRLWLTRTALLVAISTLLIGCFGGAFNLSDFAGNFTGTGTLDNGKTGDLALTCDSNGIVTGTLTVTGADGTQTFKFTAGVYALSGSLTSTGGNFEVTGTVPTQGDFFIRGNLPRDGSARSYTVSTDEAPPTVYNGTLVRIP